MPFSRFILPAFVVLNLWTHGSSAAGRMQQNDSQTLETRGIRNADYNANGPLPKVDTGNNRTMDSGPSEGSMRTPRDLKNENTILGPRRNAVAASQPEYLPALNHPSRRALQTPNPGAQKMRDSLAPRARHGDRLTSSGNLVKNSREVAPQGDRPASSVNRRDVSARRAKAAKVRPTIPTQAPPSF